MVRLEPSQRSAVTRSAVTRSAARSAARCRQELSQCGEMRSMTRRFLTHRRLKLYRLAR